MVVSWPWLLSEVPTVSPGRLREGKMAFPGDCELTEGFGERQMLLLLFVFHTERTRNKYRFTRVESMMVLTAKSHQLEPLKFEKVGLHLFSV